jgi:hypothetical protein
MAGCIPVLPSIDAGSAPAAVVAHAHNDYEHPRPLLDALDQHFGSVEADVYPWGAEIGVSHTGPPFKGTLKELYLEPLQARVAQNGGSVLGDGKPFYLWLDLKQSSQSLQDALVAQLAEYPMLTRFADDGETPGAVTVVLTGDDRAKRALVARPAPRLFIRDSNDYASGDPSADDRWGYYAVFYYSFLSWSGEGAISASERAQLKNLIDGAHAKGRKLRIYASPDTPAYWKVAKELGLDFISVDDLSGLRSALDSP